MFNLITSDICSTGIVIFKIRFPKRSQISICNAKERGFEYGIFNSFIAGLGKTEILFSNDPSLSNEIPIFCWLISNTTSVSLLCSGDKLIRGDGIDKNPAFSAL